MLAVYLLVNSIALAQTPSWQSAVTISQVTGSQSSVSSIAVDTNGDVYLTGWFSGTARFGATSLVSSGGRDIFVAKWNSTNASFTWAQKAGGIANDSGSSIAITGSTIYLCGYFAGTTANFGNVTLATAGGSDVFVAKLNETGTTASFSWVQRAGGTNSDQAYSLALSGNNIYVGGVFSGPTASFGNNILTKTTSGLEAFIAKFTDQGNSSSLVWVQRTVGTAFNDMQQLAVDGANIYFGGCFFSPTLRLGNITLTNLNPTADNSDIYVAKLVDAGNSASFVWAQSAGGADNIEFIHAITVNGPNVYVAGEFRSTQLNFGSFTLDNTTAPPYYDGDDGFVAKLTDAGNTGSFVWAQRVGGIGYEYVWDLSVNGNNLYLTGEFDSATAIFGGVTVASNNLGIPDIFVAKLIDSGSSANFMWAQQAGGLNEDFSRALAIFGPTVYIGGNVAPVTNFGSHIISTPVGSSASQIGFLASLSEPSLLATDAAAPLAGLNVYPNPAHTHTTINIPAVLQTTNSTLTLTDALGRVVRSQDLVLHSTENKSEISLLNLAPGLYWLQLRTNKTSVIRQILVN